MASFFTNQSCTREHLISENGMIIAPFSTVTKDQHTNYFPRENSFFVTRTDKKWQMFLKSYFCFFLVVSFLGCEEPDRVFLGVREENIHNAEGEGDDTPEFWKVVKIKGSADSIGSYTASGSVIRNYGHRVAILTCAHCISVPGEDEEVVNAETVEFPGTGIETRGITSAYKFPGYYAGSRLESSAGDIGLVFIDIEELDLYATYPNGFRPLESYRLSERLLENGDPVVVAGFGLKNATIKLKTGALTHYGEEIRRWGPNRIKHEGPLFERQFSNDIQLALKGFWTGRRNAVVCQGDSGGPVVNEEGKIVGVLTTVAVTFQESDLESNRPVTICPPEEIFAKTVAGSIRRWIDSCLTDEATCTKMPDGNTI